MTVEEFHRECIQVAAKLRTGSVLEYDKVQLSYSAPSWRGLVVFSWTVFPGGLGLFRTPRHLPFFQRTSVNFS